MPGMDVAVSLVPRQRGPDRIAVLTVRPLDLTPDGHRRFRVSFSPDVRDRSLDQQAAVDSEGLDRAVRQWLAQVVRADPGPAGRTNAKGRRGNTHVNEMRP
jgi:hypothetical protein